MKLSDLKHPPWAIWFLKLPFGQLPCHWKLAHALPPLLGGSHLRASTPLCHLQGYPDPNFISWLLSGHLLRVNSRCRPSNRIGKQPQRGQGTIVEGIPISDSSLIRCLLRSWLTRLKGMWTFWFFKKWVACSFSGAHPVCKRSLPVVREHVKCWVLRSTRPPDL